MLIRAAPFFNLVDASETSENESNENRTFWSFRRDSIADSAACPAFFSFFPLRDGFSFDREFHSNAAWPRFVSFLCFRLFYSPREITAICILKLRIVAVWDSCSFYWTRTFVLVEKYSETVCWFKTLLEAVQILWRFVFQTSLYPCQYYEIFRLDKSFCFFFTVDRSFA